MRYKQHRDFTPAVAVVLIIIVVCTVTLFAFGGGETPPAYQSGPTAPPYGSRLTPAEITPAVDPLSVWIVTFYYEAAPMYSSTALGGVIYNDDLGIVRWTDANAIPHTQKVIDNRVTFQLEKGSQ